MERLRAQILADSVDSVEFADCAKCEMLGARVKPTPDELKRLPVVKG
jgi:hypothetical protein